MSFGSILNGASVWSPGGRFLCNRTRAVLAVVLFSTSLHALNPTQRITQYAHSSWTRKEGQVPSSVFAVAQTTDGNLWVGTEVGLWRFDGQHFQPANVPGVANSVFSLASAADGSLWIGSENSVHRWANGRVKTYETRRNAPFAGPNSILVASDRMVWVGTISTNAGALCRVDANDLQCFSQIDPVLGHAISSLFEDRSHNLWATGIGGLCQWRPESGCTHLYGPEARSAYITEDLQRRIWLSDRTEGGLKYLANGKVVRFPLHDKELKIRPGPLLCDRDGGLWIGTIGQGLLHLWKGRIDRFTAHEGLSHDTVRRLFEDREGNIWVATDGGVDRFRDYAVSLITTVEGLSSDTVFSLASIGGEVWIATGGGVDRIQDSNIRAYDTSNGLPSDSVWTVGSDSNGKVLVGTSEGLAFFENGNFARELDRSPPIKMQAATPGKGESLWISDTKRGLFRLHEHQIVPVAPLSEFKNEVARVLEADNSDGGVWLGLATGVAYFKPGALTRRFLVNGPVTDLHLAADGALWIASEHGLSRLQNGKIEAMTQTGGLPCQAVHAMVEDDSGALWLNTACGLVRIGAQELAAWSADSRKRINPRIFGQYDGMPVSQRQNGYARRAAKSKDGRLWFVTLSGVAVVDPNHLPENPVPPPVFIDQITADRRPAGTTSVVLPPLTRDLEIDYEALSFVAPEKVAYRYRLDGYDEDWKEASPGGRQAIYTNLGPAHYRFHVIACNNDGVWNTTGAAVDFEIAPAYYQTKWFDALCVAVLGLLLFAAHRLRIRFIRNRIKLRFEVTYAERTRISRDLHDTLLQNLAGFALQLDGLSKVVKAPLTAKDRITDLRRQLEEWQRDARLTISNVRLPVSTGDDLAEDLRNTGSSLTMGKPINFRLDVKGRKRPLPRMIEQELSSIAIEAIRNAVRHSGAAQIHVSIVYNWKQLTLRIKDDGRGFDLEQGSLKPDHWGLTSMRERAQKIGAELELNTSPGHGTEIVITASLKNRAGAEL